MQHRTGTIRNAEIQQAARGRERNFPPKASEVFLGLLLQFFLRPLLFEQERQKTATKCVSLTISESTGNNKFHLLPTGNKLRAFTKRPKNPAIATGCRTTVIPAAVTPPGRPRTLFPNTALMIPPPNELCRNSSNGRAGNKDGSLTKVS